MRIDGSSLAGLLTVAITAASSPRAASAGAFVTPANTVTNVRGLSMLLIHDGSRETLVQELEVINTAPEPVWLIALPSKPTSVRAAEPALLSNLDELTEVREPHNEALRRNLFGPSVVTLLTRRLMDAPTVAEERPDTSNQRKLEMTSYAVFSGRVTTSTITHHPELPLALSILLAAAGGADLATEVALATYLNRDFALVAVSLRDPRPSGSVAAKLGPLVFELATPRPVVPLGLMHLREKTPFRLYVASPLALAPVALEAYWDTQPWTTTTQEHQSNVFYVSYNRSITIDDPIDFELRQRSQLAVPPSVRLLRSDLVLAPGPRIDIDLVQARETVSLPTPGGNGSTLDLSICVLLGLTPLLYTPESWFLLWLGARSRTRARKEGRPVGIRFWSAYALIVGAYWFFTLPAGGRVASIVPALVGIVQLALPYVEREPAPIRVQFKKKKA